MLGFESDTSLDYVVVLCSVLILDFCDQILVIGGSTGLLEYLSQNQATLDTFTITVSCTLYICTAHTNNIDFFYKSNRDRVHAYTSTSFD